MPQQRVNYDRIASTYHRRYEADAMQPIADALCTLADETGAARVLEVGCGTGRWLTDLAAPSRGVVGIDASFGMLRRAREQGLRAGLVHAVAEALPLPALSADMLYVVNALHHFAEPRRFMAEAARVLRPGGLLALVGMAHPQPSDWYVYEYFEGTYETDAARFAPEATVREWLVAAGFRQVESRTAYDIVERFAGREVFGNPFMRKESTSQLVLLTDEAYQAGLARIRAAIAEAEAAGKQIVFTSSLRLMLITARRPA